MQDNKGTDSNQEFPQDLQAASSGRHVTETMQTHGLSGRALLRLLHCLIIPFGDCLSRCIKGP